MSDPRFVSRRVLLRAALALPVLVACRPGRGAGPDASPTPAVPDLDEPVTPLRQPVCARTDSNIEGPFFKAGAPANAVLAGDRDPGARVAIAGQVRSTSCAPLAGAALEVWHADHLGRYDLAGYRFRGRLSTAKDGTFRIATIVPGRYLNGDRYRPAHVHVKLAAPGFRPLTTQLYFPGDPYNEGDAFFQSSLVLKVRDAGGAKVARFDFVLEPAV